MKTPAMFRDRALRPDQLNEHNQITDKQVLNKERFKFGFGCVMYQSEETGITPIHTAVIRALGGTEAHLGWMGALGCTGSIVQWIGALLLRRFQSNKIAMNVALSGGVLFGTLLTMTLLLSHFAPATKAFCLILYLVFAYGLAGASGVQNNVETSWIGDLVPKEIRGWFTGVKWIIASLGVLSFVLFFGAMATWSPTLPTYALLFVVIAVSHVVAIVLMSTITDRRPQSASFFLSKEKSGRLNYRSLPLWCYIWFYLTWAGGRTALLAFVTAYLLDAGYKMDVIVLIISIQNIISMVMLVFMGRVTDRFGTRIPLMIISAVVGFSMMLWTASAWWGVAPIIIYQVINGAAGQTHSMLGINYGLEIFPAKGRSGYIGFSRIIIGVGSLALTVMVGYIMQGIRGFSFELWGTTITHYHLLFIGCSLVTMSAVLPLLIAGRRVVEPPAAG